MSIAADTPAAWTGANDAESCSRRPDLEWAASGAMMLTGTRDGPPRLAPAPFAARAREVVSALAVAARDAGLPGAANLMRIDGAALLGERAACAAFTRHGTTSPGGSCHLVRCTDGWIAVNLARAEDVALIPAWLADVAPEFRERETFGPSDDVIKVIARAVYRASAGALVDRARLLGMPVAPAVHPAAAPPHWYRGKAAGAATALRRRIGERPLVVDLSSLWAGPLCAHLLALAGARVVKVESTRRLDGARSGPTAFYDLLNAGKESVALDFATAEGRRILCALVERADIVVESSRPRALAQLGIDAAASVRSRPGLVWTSITGYGRDEPQAGWVAFGDDAAVAAGVAMAMAGTDETPLFCGDAIADPLTGVHAALAALCSWINGESALIDVSLHDVTAYCLSPGIAGERAAVRRPPPHRAHGDDTGAHRDAEHEAWEVTVDGETQAVLPPRARAAAAHARPAGADTRAVLESLAIEC